MRNWRIKDCRDYVSHIVETGGGREVLELLVWFIERSGCCTDKELRGWVCGKCAGKNGKSEATKAELEKMIEGLEKSGVLVFGLRVHEGMDTRGNSLDTWYTWDRELGREDGGSGQGETNRLLIADARRDGSLCHWAISELSYGRIIGWYKDITSRYSEEWFVAQRRWEFLAARRQGDEHALKLRRGVLVV